MSKDFTNCAYQAHHDTFRHYSALLFTARLSIVTVVLLAFVYLLGLLPGDKSEDGEIQKVVGFNGRGVVAFLSAFLISLLFKMETAYVDRLVEVAYAAGRLERAEGAQLYFTQYRRLPHWPVDLVHLLGVVLMVIIAVECMVLGQGPFWSAAINVAALAPVLLSCHTIARHWIGTRQRSSAQAEAIDESPKNVEA